MSSDISACFSALNGRDWEPGLALIPSCLTPSCSNNPPNINFSWGVIFGAILLGFVVDTNGLGPEGLPDTDAARFCRKLLRGFGASSLVELETFDSSEVF